VTDRLVFARSPAGEPVAECELDAPEVGLLPELVRAATSRGCAWLWVHSDANLSPAGFTARPGYRRFTAASPPPAEPLPLLDTAEVLRLLPRAFIGQWGHHEFDAAWAGSAQASYVGLGRPGAWTGLCRFEPDRRHVDGPGFPARAGSPDAVRRLVLGALARLGPGPVTVETWGEPAGPYLELGLAIAAECGGWERALPLPHRRSGSGP
jgi:hypothetical protein